MTRPIHTTGCIAAGGSPNSRSHSSAPPRTSRVSMADSPMWLMNAPRPQCRKSSALASKSSSPPAAAREVGSRPAGRSAAAPDAAAAPPPGWRRRSRRRPRPGAGGPARPGRGSARPSGDSGTTPMPTSLVTTRVGAERARAASHQLLDPTEDLGRRAARPAAGSTATGSGNRPAPGARRRRPPAPPPGPAAPRASRSSGPRSARCRSMRARISSSNAWAVARNTPRSASRRA